MHRIALPAVAFTIALTLPIPVYFEGDGTLQLTGEARIVWDAGRAARFAGAERVVEFRGQEAIETRGVFPLRWRFEGYSPFNPA